MTIYIKELEINVIIGILEQEKDIAQRLIVDLEASYDYKQGKPFVNYADIAELITIELASGQYGLLEDALIGLKNKVCDNFPQISRLFIKLTKPDILSNCLVGTSQEWIF
jgi:7,8-dihydroneopterin aldolase/epimerase/oxygenase